MKRRDGEEAERVARHLPLTPLSMAILVALSERALHGYGLMREVESQSGGVLRPGTGTLNAALLRLLDDGLIREVEGEGGAATVDPVRALKSE